MHFQLTFVGRHITVSSQLSVWHGVQHGHGTDQYRKVSALQPFWLIGLGKQDKTRRLHQAMSAAAQLQAAQHPDSRLSRAAAAIPSAPADKGPSS